MKTFLFMLTFPNETVRELDSMNESAQLAKVRRLIGTNRSQILRMLEQSILDQVNNPREMAELHQGPGGESVRAVSRVKKSVDDLPETHGGDHGHD